MQWLLFIGLAGLYLIIMALIKRRDDRRHAMLLRSIEVIKACRKYQHACDDYKQGTIPFTTARASLIEMRAQLDDYYSGAKIEKIWSGK